MKLFSHNYFATLVLFIAVCLSVNLVVGAESSGINVRLAVPGCNNDSICEPGSGEDALSCPIDCGGATSTPTTTPPTTGGGGSGGPSGYEPGYESFTIDGVVINVEKNQAQVSWKTHLPTLSTVTWGTSLDYELGSLSESSFLKDHVINIDNLYSNTRYYFLITARSAAGQTAQYAGSFVTLPVPGTVSPANVSYFRAYPYQNGIGLEWKNPTDILFDGVRIVRSPFSYPRDPLEGEIVYEGKDQFFLDLTVRKNVMYYYTLFVRNTTGDYSSGALARAILSGEQSPLDSNNGTPIPGVTPTDNSIPFTLYDFDFIQNGSKISFFGNEIKVVPHMKLVVSLEKERAAPVKRLSISFDLSQGPLVYQFQKNKIGEWILTAPEYLIKNNVPFFITVETSVGKKDIHGMLIPTPVKTEKPYPDYLFLLLIILILILIIMTLCILLLRRKKHQ